MKYAAKKIGLMLLTMVIVSFLAFLAFQVIPGDPAVKLLGTEATPERIAALRAIAERYAAENLGHFEAALAEELSRTLVWKITPTEITAKARLHE